MALLPVALSPLGIAHGDFETVSGFCAKSTIMRAGSVTGVGISASCRDTFGSFPFVFCNRVPQVGEQGGPNR
jgi:hypothetical protein